MELPLPETVVHASITAERLRSLCQGMRLPELLEDASSDRARNGMATQKLSGTQRRLSGEIVSSPYSGQLSNLYREGKMLEIVASVFSDLIGEKETPKAVLGHEQSKFKMACDRTLSDLTSVPTPEALAREVELPTRRLGELFREVARTTMTEWVLQNKLAMAGKLLLEGDLAVQQIAAHLGYAHVSNFSSAFRNQLGFPPAAYRKSRIATGFFRKN
ncbi:MAG: AraC family transcriptional regulator [Rhodospirillaceae bacterium]